MLASLVLRGLVILSHALGGVAHAQSKCDVGVTKAVAKKVSAKLKVIAKGQQKGQPPDTGKLAKADSKFTDNCTKGKSKNDCQVQTSTCADLELTADAAIDVLSGETTPTTTSSTTPSPTTTSTTTATSTSTTTSTTTTTSTSTTTSTTTTTTTTSTT